MFAGKKTGESITTATDNVKCLIVEALSITQPNTSPEDREATAQDYILRHVKHFINRKCFKAYDKWLEKSNGVQKITLEKARREVHRLENLSPEYALTKDKKLPSEVTILDVYSKDAIAQINFIKNRIPGFKQKAKSETPGSSKSRNSSSGHPPSKPGSKDRLRRTQSKSPGKKPQHQSQSKVNQVGEDKSSPRPPQQERGRPTTRTRSIIAIARTARMGAGFFRKLTSPFSPVTRLSSTRTRATTSGRSRTSPTGPTEAWASRKLSQLMSAFKLKCGTSSPTARRWRRTPRP